MRAAAILFLLGLAACQHTAPQATTREVCAFIRTLTPEEQRQLREAVLRAGSPEINQALAEWISLRDQARACLARRSKGAR